MMCDDMWSVALIYLSAYTSLLIKVSLPGYGDSSRYEMLLSRTSTLSLRGRMWDDSVSSEGWTPSLPSRLLHDSLVDMQVASRQTLPYWVCDCKARRDTLQSALSIRLFLCVILRGTLANINQLIHIIFTDLSQINMLLSRA